MASVRLHDPELAAVQDPEFNELASTKAFISFRAYCYVNIILKIEYFKSLTCFIHISRGNL